MTDKKSREYKIKLAKLYHRRDELTRTIEPLAEERRKVCREINILESCLQRGGETVDRAQILNTYD